MLQIAGRPTESLSHASTSEGRVYPPSERLNHGRAVWYSHRVRVRPQRLLEEYRRRPLQRIFRHRPLQRSFPHRPLQLSESDLNDQ